MGYNKIQTKEGKVLMDLTSDTVTPDTVLKGYTGHDKAGNPFVGVLKPDIFPPDEIPAYVKAEALSVAERVKPLQTPGTITFLAVSDSHHADGQTGGDSNLINPGNLHMAMAMKILAHTLSIDFAAGFGDFCLGVQTTDKSMLISQLEEINSYLAESYDYFPQLRTVGNHDTGQYRYRKTSDVSQLTGTAELQRLITDYNEGAVYGDKEFGYCYRDFPDKKFRMIVLNTCELEVTGGENYDTIISEKQLQWFADTIYDIGGKAGWSFAVMGHFPLDYVYMIRVAHLLRAYVEGRAATSHGVSADYTGHNAAKFVANFHGHLHNFRTAKLHDTHNGEPVSGGAVPEEFDARAICIPNACALYNNAYKNPIYGINYHDDVDYPKTPGTEKDTSFVVNVIDPEKQVIHSIHYGAGIDRAIGYAATVYYSIQAQLTGASLSNSIVSVEKGKPYSADIVLAEKYEIETATVTMDGVNITSTALSGNRISIPAVTGDVVITIVAIKPASYTNQVPISTDAVGNIYNGVGYRDNAWIYEGEETEDTSGTHPTLTGFIPCATVPYVIRVGGTAIKDYKGYGNSIHWYDGSKKYIGTTPFSRIGTAPGFGEVLLETNPNQAVAWKITEQTGYNKVAKYFRLNYRTLRQGSGLIVTINEPIDDGTPMSLRASVQKTDFRAIDGVTPFANGERGVWGGKLYESTMDNNTWTPESFPDVWRLIE